MLELLIFAGVVLGVIIAGIATSFIAVMLSVQDDPYQDENEPEN